jgi:adenylate cyclase
MLLLLLLPQSACPRAGDSARYFWDATLGLSIGIALGYATLGRVGFEGQFHYGAVGSVMNLAFRLCDQARGGQILATQRVYAAVEEFADMEPIGELTLKGFHRPVPAFQVLGLKGNKA